MEDIRQFIKDATELVKELEPTMDEKAKSRFDDYFETIRMVENMNQKNL